MTVCVTVLGATLFASSAYAQGRGMRGSVGARIGGGFRAGGGEGFARTRRPLNGSALLTYPYFYSGYEDYDYEEPERPPVQVFVVQQPAQSTVTTSAIEPQVLEYRNGQWVRVATNGQPVESPQVIGPIPGVNAGPNPAPSPGRQSEYAPPAQATPTATELPPAVLVFRDGHREEVTKYTIKGDVISASADYWSTGMWTRDIPVSALDIPATRKANADQGGKFDLPSGPNEIVMRF